MSAAETVASPPSASTPECAVAFWSHRINGFLTKSIESLVAAGHELLAAKSRLGHGQFQNLFAAGHLKIDLRTAQILMRVAKNKTLSKTKNFTHLPPALASLNVLAGLDKAALQDAITSGAIHSAMTIDEAKFFVKKLRPTNKEATTENPPLSQLVAQPDVECFDIDDARARIRNILNQEFRKWPDEMHANLAREIISCLEFISAQDSQA